MKKLFVALAAASLLLLLAGCTATSTPPKATQTIDPYNDWKTYTDPQNAFTLRYPSDWTQTDAKDEVQFWDNLDDEKNSIKMILTQGETIVEKKTTTLNGKEVTITRGTSLTTPYQRYEYTFETFTLSLTALFNEDTPELRELATKVQESIKPTTPSPSSN